MKKLWQTIKEIDDPDNPEWKTAYEELLIKCGWVKQNERLVKQLLDLSKIKDKR